MNTPSETEELKVVNLEGQPTGQQLQLAAPLPSDITPGEIIMNPDSQGNHRWFFFTDKQRIWTGGRWKLTGSIYEFDPSKITEKEIYALRKKLLKINGWID